MVKMDPDEVLEECSDEEEFKAGLGTGNFWSPSAEEVSELYEKITASKFLELSWQCPGRSNPDDEASFQEVQAEPAAKEEEPETKTEFDNFDDDDKPTLRPALKSTPKGSAKKKTTSLASILTNMERTRYIEELGSEGRTLLLQASKPITSTPDSISQSIDRVLGSQAAMEPTEAPESLPDQKDEERKEDVNMETEVIDSSFVTAPATTVAILDTSTVDTFITTTPAIQPDPGPQSQPEPEPVDNATNETDVIPPIITTVVPEAEKSEGESVQPEPTAVAPVEVDAAPAPVEETIPSTTESN